MCSDRLRRGRKDDLEWHRRFASERFREAAPFPPTCVPDLRSDIMLKQLQRGSRLILIVRARRVVCDDELGRSAVAPAVLPITLEARNQAGRAITRHDADDGDRGCRFLLSRRPILSAGLLLLGH
jgi:hypothetical protein